MRSLRISKGSFAAERLRQRQVWFLLYPGRLPEGRLRSQRRSSHDHPAGEFAMSGFRNILVGIDLAHYPIAGTAPPDPIAASTVQTAMWIARTSGAPLTLIAVFAPGAATNRAAHQALDALVGQAREQGIEAHAAPVVGHARVEIVRKVVENHHDLLMVGTHDPHGLRHLLLGSTASKLVHECPCSVWVSRASAAAAPRRILVASNLSPLSDLAVQVGVDLGHLAGAHTHLLDVVEYPADRLLGPYPADPVSKQYHRRIQANADAGLHAQAERSGASAADPSVSVHVADGDGLLDHAIVSFIREHDIDLLVLGTAARHGLASIVHGNAAERLLPAVPCSVLTVKSAGNA
jgi:universal stress protein E